MTDIIKHGNNASLQAVQALKSGKIIALPTETVYGLAVLADNRQAVHNLYELKNRPKHKPLPQIILSASHLRSVCKTNELSDKLCEKFWPGPLTLVLPAKAGGTLAVRCPDIGWRNDFLQYGLDEPIMLTSANISGQAPLNSAKQIAKAFGKKIALVIDGGVIKNSPPSTILRIHNNKAELLRAGALGGESLADIKIYGV